MLERYQSSCRARQEIIVSRDRKSKNPVEHVAENPTGNSVRQYCLDDRNILGGNASCCDYLVLNCEKKRAYFIEFKGRHVLKAKRQFESAEALLREDIIDFVRFYRILYRGSTHDVQSREIVMWKKAAGFRDGVPVIVVKSHQYKERIDF
jgi:hypothetical protein